MTFLPRLAILLTVLALAAAVSAQGREAPLTASETERFREAQPGEWALTHFVTWAPKYVNVTDTRGFDDSFSRRLVPSMTLVSARYEAALSYRLGHESWINIRPTAHFGYGYSVFRSHEEFRLATVDREVPARARFGITQIHTDIGASLGLRLGSHEALLDWSSTFAWRFQTLKAQETTATDPSSGLIDALREPLRRETHPLELHSLGLGYALHFGNEPWNYRIALTAIRVASLVWQDRHAVVTGMGIDFRADGFRLSDDVGLALHFKFDFWLPQKDFNDIFWFELGLGVRFS